MYARDSVMRLFCIAVLAAVSFFTGAAAADLNQGKTVDGVTVYAGILPSEMIRGPPKEHAESSMHGGASSGSGLYHVVVALFDSKTGQRISNAEVRANVAELGLAGEEKKLQTMSIAGTTTYGNFFKMPSMGPYRIVVRVRRPGASHVVEAVFEHRHQ